MAQKTEPILDLRTVVDREHIRIDGKLFEIRSPEEFALLQYKQDAATFDRLGLLFRKKKLTKAETVERSVLLDKFIKGILLAPDAVHAKLNEMQRMAITTAFFLIGRANADDAAKSTKGRPNSPAPARTRTGKVKR